MKRSRYLTIFGCAVSALILGCASTQPVSYIGSQCSPSESAYVSLKNAQGKQLAFRTLDGRPIDSRARKIAIAPGKHTLTVDTVLDLMKQFGFKSSTPGWTTTATAKGYKDFEFEAHAKKTYIIDFSPELSLHEK